jgi:tripeptidyl-peptidase-1
VNDPESALQADLGAGAELFASSGGFSNYFPQVDYQAEAVNSFLSTQKFPFSSYNVTAGDSVGARGGVFNIAGRGYPDVSANGALFDLYVEGSLQQEYGTSLAAPIWAGVATLVSFDLSVTRFVSNHYEDQRSTIRSG